MGRHFITLRGEEERYASIDRYLYNRNILMDDDEVKRKVKGEMRLFQQFVEDKVDLGALFYEYNLKLQGLNYSGPVIIRPFKSLFEAVTDGVKGVYDSGLLAYNISEEDGYLFVIRIPGNEEKTFGYVLYNREGNVIQARQAFGLDIENRTVLSCIKRFSVILTAALNNKIKKEA